jgi:1,4-alpha-glucan branching enzyme
VGTWVGLWEQRARELGFDRSPARREAAEREYAVAAQTASLLESRWSAGGSPVWTSLRDNGIVELLGGPAAHPLLPLLLPEFVEVPLRAGLDDSLWRLGARPRGVWLPECAWSPALAEPLAASGVGHFVVDEQTVRDSGGHPHAAWQVTGTELVAVPRDLDVTNLIWSSRTGYPAGAAYRDFHARDEYTGTRLWAVTGSNDGAKRYYDPGAAERQVDRDVEDFVAAVRRRLVDVHATNGRPGLVVAAYDTELFGHWWHEGPAFLGTAVRALRAAGVTVTTLTGAIEGGLVAGQLDLRAGSWGAGKDFSVWDGAAVRDIARENEWLQLRWLDLMAREAAAGRLRTRRRDLDRLLVSAFHALSSDWAFLVTRGQSVDYARDRAELHRREFHALAQLIEDGADGDAAREAARLALRDNAFPELDARVYR